MNIKLYFFIFLLSILSCTKKKSEVNNDNVKEIKHEELKKKSIVDSSRLIKIFENVYFGSKDTIEFGRKCTIAYLPFEYKYSGMYKDYGLYSFGLESEHICDYNTCLDIMEDIKNIISLKYNTPIKLKLKKEPTEYSEADKLFYKNKMENLMPPGDNFTNKFYEWKKNNITVELSTTTFYREKDETKAKLYCPTSAKYQKYYIIKIGFKNDTVINIIENNYKMEQQEKEKYYKEGLNNDAKKF